MGQPSAEVGVIWTACQATVSVSVPVVPSTRRTCTTAWSVLLVATDGATYWRVLFVTDANTSGGTVNRPGGNVIVAVPAMSLLMVTSTRPTACRHGCPAVLMRPRIRCVVPYRRTRTRSPGPTGTSVSGEAATGADCPST